jgi:hypothetical protein
MAAFDWVNRPDLPREETEIAYLLVKKPPFGGFFIASPTTVGVVVQARRRRVATLTLIPSSKTMIPR